MPTRLVRALLLIAFSHKPHLDTVKLACLDCHVEPAKFGDPVAIPGPPKCMECHGDPPNKPLTMSGVRTFALKDFVFFDHRYHLQNGAHCEDCHGATAAQDATKMTFCQPCHVKSGAKTGCNTCHDVR